ncbi:nucleotidyltransferase domain-containing protein [Orrella daihaiensis]|uniref:Nucleotidyltransferase domain-containing protein n=1 Tax=Orrella daihaiensis TaxID=2782176 RepID=A0ABY4AN94_9BURK|nr:nucleotidyltransferase domain-containing protein [Orrella daihaiensis]UOD51438.1 nucleotidyltransferase domain-containing protein [Orrella daihaiensis]
MSVADLLFPNQYRRKVLAFLAMNPDVSVHLRELARLTHTSPGTLKKELDLLVAADLVKSKAQGNQVQFCINPDHPVYQELQALIRKTIGLYDVLANALRPLADHLEVAFVFGSVAKETETSHSDIDVLIIGDVTFGQIHNALYDAQKVLSREINPKVMSRDEWTRKRQEGNAFVKDIVSKPKIFIIGSEHDL